MKEWNYDCTCYTDAFLCGYPCVDVILLHTQVQDGNNCHHFQWRHAIPKTLLLLLLLLLLYIFIYLYIY